MDDSNGGVATYTQKGTYFEATFFPLPPTVVVRGANDVYHAFWVYQNASPEPSFDIPGVVSVYSDPGLRYDMTELASAMCVPEAVGKKICTPTILPEKQRQARDIGIVSSLVRSGFDQGLIELVFSKMPIGQPYNRETPGINGRDLVDTFVKDLISCRPPLVPFAERDLDYRFHLGLATQWWQRERIKQGQVALQEDELRAMLVDRLVTGRLGCYVMPETAIRLAGSAWKMIGISKKEYARMYGA